MSLAARHALMDEALALTDRMVDLGDAGEWEQVIETEVRRRRLLEAAFSTRTQVDEELAGKVRRLLATDQALMARARDIQGRLADELTQSNRGRAATSAYRATGA